MANLVQFSDLQAVSLTASTDYIPIIRPTNDALGYVNYKATIGGFIPDTASYALSASKVNYNNTVISSSFSVTSSFAQNLESASYAATASKAESSSFATTASHARTASYATWALGIFTDITGSDSASYSLTSSHAFYAETTSCVNYSYASYTSSHASMYLDQPKPVYAYRVWTAESLRPYDIETVPFPVWSPISNTSKDIIDSVTYITGSTITPNNMEVCSIPTYRGAIDRWSPNIVNSGGVVGYRMYGVRVWIKAGTKVSWRTRWADEWLYVYDGPAWANDSWSSDTPVLLGSVSKAGVISHTFMTDGLHTLFFVFWNQTQQVETSCQLNEWIDGYYVKFDGIPGIPDNSVLDIPVCDTDLYFYTWPVGSVVAFSGTTGSFPGWFECNGDAVLKDEPYLDLYNTIANESLTASYGYTCDSSGNRDEFGSYFKLPDLRGEFIRGWDNGRGVDTDRLLGSSQSSSIGYHTHGYIWYSPEINYNTFVNASSSQNYNTYGAPIYRYLHPGFTYAMSQSNGVDYGNITSSWAGGLTDTSYPRNIAMAYYIRWAGTEKYNSVRKATLIDGDVQGSLFASTVTSIQNVAVSSSARTPNAGDTLVYNGSKWINTGEVTPLTIHASNPLSAVTVEQDLYYIYYPNLRGSGSNIDGWINASGQVGKFAVRKGDTNQVQFIANLPFITPTLDNMNLSKVKSTDGKNYIVGVTLGKIMTYDYESVVPTLNVITVPNTITSTCKCIAIDATTQPTRPAYYVATSAYYASDTQGDSYSILVKCIAWDGFQYLDGLAGTGILNFAPYTHDTTTTGPLTFGSRFDNYNNLEGTWSSIGLFFWNPIKNRFYVLTNASGLLHIFNIQRYFDANPSNWLLQWLSLSDANKATYLDYEKSVTVNGTDAYVGPEDVGQAMGWLLPISIDFDTTTGQEKYITMVRRGHVAQGIGGSITRIPWPSNA